MLECNEGSFEGWYVIERNGRRINGADIEGTADDMRTIASAIEQRGFVSCGRCAVDARQGAHGPEVNLWSPRNSISNTSVSLREADALAAQIRAKLGGGRC